MKFSAPDPAKQAAVEAAAASQGVVDAAAEELVRNDPGMFWDDDGCITLAEATHMATTWRVSMIASSPGPI